MVAATFIVKSCNLNPLAFRPVIPIKALAGGGNGLSLVLLIMVGVALLLTHVFGSKPPSIMALFGIEMKSVTV
jgi:hypothetical protein